MAANRSRLEALTNQDILIERLPQSVLSTMEVRDRWFTHNSGPTPGNTESFAVEDLLRWPPGHVVRVAFLSGSSNLHREIAEATEQITDACNISFDFGYNPETGRYRTWSTGDEEYAAEIRVSFDQDGYFSLLGSDSVNPNIGASFHAVGGRPHQRTLNLEGFHISKPVGWQGVVRHEFLHALAFHHEHQSPNSACERYSPDHAGRAPGIYTYLAGYPNFWPKSDVDHNLRRLPPAGISFREFDRASIMLYRFPAMFYRTNPSPCGPTTDGQDLSEGVIEGLLHLYPHEAPAAEALSMRRSRAFEAVLSREDVSEPLKASLTLQHSMIMR
jgi:hypothetical protein